MENRRTFIKTAFGAGILVATSQLPVQAKDKPELFPCRGKFERLSLDCITIKAGATKPFSVLHLTDTHLTAAYPEESEKNQELSRVRTQTFGGRQEEALEDSLAWAKLNCDYVVHTGDLIDYQSQANFDLVKKYFGENVIGCPGNHEFSTDMWLSDPPERKEESYKNETRLNLEKFFPYNLTFGSQVVNGVNFVMIDDVYGTVTQENVQRFAKEVEKGLPIILCVHVPFYTEHIWRATCRFWNHPGVRFDGVTDEPTGDYQRQLTDPVTRDFIAYLKTEKLLKAILSGHEHCGMQEQFSPTATQYVAGANFHFHADDIMII